MRAVDNARFARPLHIHKLGYVSGCKSTNPAADENSTHGYTITIGTNARRTQICEAHQSKLQVRFIVVRAVCNVCVCGESVCMCVWNVDVMECVLASDLSGQRGINV